MLLILVEFFVGVFLLSLGQLARSKRFSLLIRDESESNFLRLNYALSIGNILNVIFPFKIGEIIRAYLSSPSKTYQNISLFIASVIYERLIDVFSLLIIITLFYQGFSYVELEELWSSYAQFSLIIITFSLILVTCRRFIKKVIFNSSLIFSNDIRRKTLFLVYTIFQFPRLRMVTISKMKFILISIVMWMLYFLSYRFFASVVTNAPSSEELSEMVNSIFNLNYSLIGDKSFLSNRYILLNLAGSIIIAIYLSILGFKKRKNLDDVLNYSLLTFANSDAEMKFMTVYFASENDEFCRSYQKLHEGGQILDDKTKASGAVTSIFRLNNQIFYRKFATGFHQQEFLKQQVVWMKSCEAFPVAEIAASYDNPDLYCFDMPYRSEYKNLSELIKLTDVNLGVDLVLGILESHAQNSKKISNLPQSSINYYHLKMENNFNTLSGISKNHNINIQEPVKINGVSYPSINIIDSYFNSMEFKNRIAEGRLVKVHGDFSIENIIVNDRKNNDYYLIDPDPTIDIGSEFIDISKFIFSLRSNYEYWHNEDVLQVAQNEFYISESITFTRRLIADKIEQIMLERFKGNNLSLKDHINFHNLRVLRYQSKKRQLYGLLYLLRNSQVVTEVIT